MCAYMSQTHDGLHGQKRPTESSRKRGEQIANQQLFSGLNYCIKCVCYSDFKNSPQLCSFRKVYAQKLADYHSRPTHERLLEYFYFDLALT